jgi:uncharacterized protein with PQ loop repeat
MNLPDIFATCGALISMLSNVPQAWKVRKIYTTADLHSWSVIMHLIAASLWSAYGFMLNLYILGMESGIVALLNLVILVAIIRDRCIYNNSYPRNDPRFDEKASKALP